MLNLLYYSYSKFTKVKGQYLKFGRIAVNWRKNIKIVVNWKLICEEKTLKVGVTYVSLTRPCHQLPYILQVYVVFQFLFQISLYFEGKMLHIF